MQPLARPVRSTSSSNRRPAGPASSRSCGDGASGPRSTSACASSPTTRPCSAALELRPTPPRTVTGWRRIGVSMAIEDHARELLAQLEATRRTVSLLPAARPPDDDALADQLARFRPRRPAACCGIGDVEREVARGGTGRARTPDPQPRPAGAGRGHRADVPLGASSFRLGERVLVEYADVGGELYAVTVVGGGRRCTSSVRSTGWPATSSASTRLHRLNRVQGSAASEAAAADDARAVGARLADRLLPHRVPAIGSAGGRGSGRRPARPGVGRTARADGRPVSVSPSLTGWAVARRRDDTGRRVVLVAGPGLAPRRPRSTPSPRCSRGADVLLGEAATAEQGLAGDRRSRLVHLACHGSYRADNPLFSTLRLADGPLTVYDLERCRSMPRTVVLSACNVATSSVLRGGTLLGLASALMTFGASTVVAPLTPVNDERVVPVMVGLHRAMAAGATPASRPGRRREARRRRASIRRPPPSSRSAPDAAGRDAVNSRIRRTSARSRSS